MMEKGAMAVALLGHHIGVGGRRQGSGAEVAGVNAVAAAILQNHAAQIVMPTNPAAMSGKGACNRARLMRTL